MSKFDYLQLIWFDPMIDVDHNAKYVKTLEQDGYKVLECKSPEEFNKVLEEEKDSNVFRIVITSGSAFKKISHLLHFRFHLFGVIIFCFDKHRHHHLKLKHTHVLYVEDNFKALVKKLDELGTEVETLVNLRQRKQTSLAKAKFFLPENNRTERVIKTRLLVDFTSELTNIRLDDTSHILKRLVDLTPDAEKDIATSFEARPSPFEGFCVNYSKEDPPIYRVINYLASVKQEDKIIPFVISGLKYLKENPKAAFSGQEVYRGIHTDPKKVQEDYPVDGKGFWPAFTSTTTDVNVAMNFATQTGVIFHINLTQDDPHPNMMMESLSEFASEKEVLLFPFFSYKVLEHKVIDGTTYVIIGQNPDDSFLSMTNEFDHSKLKTELTKVHSNESGIEITRHDLQDVSWHHLSMDNLKDYDEKVSVEEFVSDAKNLISEYEKFNFTDDMKTHLTKWQMEWYIKFNHKLPSTFTTKDYSEFNKVFHDYKKYKKIVQYNLTNPDIQVVAEKINEIEENQRKLFLTGASNVLQELSTQLEHQKGGDSHREQVINGLIDMVKRDIWAADEGGFEMFELVSKFKHTHPNVKFE